MSRQAAFDGMSGGWTELVCHRCEEAFAVRAPNPDQVALPCCPACRFLQKLKDEKKGDRSDG